MKKNNLIALLLGSFVLLLVEYSFAQNKTFNLQDYKNPVYFYQTLDLNFGLNSGLSLAQSKANVTLTDNNFTLNSGAGASYSRYANSATTQSEKHISLGTGIGSSSSYHRDNLESSKYEYNSGRFSHYENLDISALNRSYDKKQNYFEVDGSWATIFNGNSEQHRVHSGDTLLSSTELNVKEFSSSVTGSFLVGHGRIEQVQDARLALFILDDLHRLNREKHIASNEEVMALAQLITSLKYKRFFDDRLRKIAEITAIDVFLQKEGIAGTPDAAYFTSLNDNWNYANNPVRYSGKRIFTGLNANLGYQYSNIYDHQQMPSERMRESTDKYETIGLFIVAGSSWEKPLSLKWQKTANLKAGIGMRQQFGFQKERAYLANDTTIKKYTGALPSVTLAADYGFGYYPTSRTWLTVKWWLLSGWDKEMDGTTRSDRKDFQNSFYIFTGPQFQAYYYLSEKLRLGLVFNGEFRYTQDKYTYTIAEGNPDKYTTKYWNQQVNASLTYSLF